MYFKTIKLICSFFIVFVANIHGVIYVILLSSANQLEIFSDSDSAANLTGIGFNLQSCFSQQNS